MENLLQEVNLQKMQKYSRLIEQSLPTWDAVLITCQDEEQATHYMDEIARRLEDRTLPGTSSYYVVPDSVAQEATIRLGNGGSTMHALHWLREETKGECDSMKLLIVHSGGWCQRMPHTSAGGKLFVPLPISLPGKEHSSCMLELKLIMLIDIPSAMSGPGIFSTCADDIQLFDSSRLPPLPEEGFWALSHPAPRELGLTHGVFQLDKNIAESVSCAANVDQTLIPVARFLHKPTYAEMEEAGPGCNFLSKLSLDNMPQDKHDILIDSSYYFSWKIASILVNFYKAHSPLTCELDMYGDVLQSLGTMSRPDHIHQFKTSVVSNLDAIPLRQELYDKLHKIPFLAIPLVPSTWDHIGTLPEYLEHFCITLPRYGFSKRLCSFLSSPEKVSDSSCIIHSTLGKNVTIERDTVLEFSNLEGDVVVGSNCVLSNVSIKQQTDSPQIRLPAGMFMQTLPVNSEGRVGYVTIVLPSKLDIKKDINPADESNFIVYSSKCGNSVSFKQVLTSLLVSSDVIWPQDQANSNLSVLRSLWNACLFPICQSAEESVQAALSLVRVFTGIAKTPQNWKSSKRFSIYQALMNKNMASFRELRHNLENKVHVATLEHLFVNDVDALKWIEQAPALQPLLCKRAPLRNGAVKATFPHTPSTHQSSPSHRYTSLATGLANHFRSAYADSPVTLTRALLSLHYFLTSLESQLKGEEMESLRKVADPIALEARHHLRDSLISSVLENSLHELPATLKDLSTIPFFARLMNILGENAKLPPLPLPLGSEKRIAYPIRINLAGAWSDTPPYCMEKGGAVINCALSMSGEKPVCAYAKVIDRPGYLLSSVDQESSEFYTDEQILDKVLNPSGMMDIGLHKAVLLYVLFPWWTGRNKRIENKEKAKSLITSIREGLFGVGRGLELETNVSKIPKGTGLGTSSILFAAVLSALSKLFFPIEAPSQTLSETCFRNYSNLYHNSVLALEQLLGTCGGWQDQVGGLVPGIKLILTEPGLVPDYNILQLELDQQHLNYIESRLIALYTGPREERAQTVLFNIADHWATRSYTAPTIVPNIHQHALDVYEVMRTFAKTPLSNQTELDRLFDELGKQLTTSKQMAAQLEQSTTSCWIETLTQELEQFVSGCNIMGAGSGGFLVGYARSGVSSEQVREYFQSAHPSTAVYSFNFSMDVEI